MKSLIHYPVKVLISGFIVLTLFSILLFWCRFVCLALLFDTIQTNEISLKSEPSGLLPSKIEQDPNIVRQSSLSAIMRPNNFLSLGIAEYFQARSPGGYRSKVYYFRSDDNYMYFDEQTNHIICHYTYAEKLPDNKTTTRQVSLFRSDNRTIINQVHVYLGPEGVSEIPDVNLGQFKDPIMDRHGFPWSQSEPRTLIIYDKILRRFFKIDFDQKIIVKGPEIKKDDLRRPIQIGQLNKNPFYLGKLDWTSPRIKFNQRDKNMPFESLEEIELWSYTDIDGPYLLVLDESGRIDLIDRETLDFAGTAGWLPAPEQHRSSQAEPKDLLCYDVKPFFIWPDISEETIESEYKKKIESIISQEELLPEPPETKSEFLEMNLEENQPTTNAVPNNFRAYGYEMMMYGMDYYGPTIWQENNSHTTYDLFHKGNKSDHPYIYKGFFATCLSQDGTIMGLSIFNEKGKQKGFNNLRLSYNPHYSRYRRSSSFDIPWSSSFVVIKYLVENLHPPIFSVLSYFTADSFEAGSGHRALFILPNSFIAMKGRDMRAHFAERFITALLLISPSIILAIFLAWRINKDAAIIGLSKNAKLFWIIGTIAFGLAAYITYRLTRPKTALVTCQNCGKPRRPDMDRCHRCKSKWHVPELIPPVWRVVD